MLKQIRRHGAAALMFCGMVAPPATSSAQDADTATAALAEWVAAMDVLPEIEANYDTLTGSGDQAVLSGLVILGAEIEIVFEPITVAGYDNLPPTGLAFGSFSVDRIQGRTPTAEINIIDLSIDNLVVPETGFVFDADRPISSILDIWGSSSQISIDELAMGRIDIGQFAGGLNSVVSYHNYIIRGWADGRIESTHAGPLVMESPSPDGLFVMTVDELVSEDIDFNALVRVFDPVAYKAGDRDWRSVLGHAEYSNIILAAPNIQMRIRAIELDDFEMRLAAEPFTPVLERLLSDPDLSSREADSLMQQILIDLISPWGLGGFSIQGLDIYADEIDRFHIGEFRIQQVSLDGLGEIGLSDVDIVVGGDGYLKLDHFALGGITLPPEETLEMLIANIAAGGEQDNVEQFIPALGFIEIGGFEFAVAGTLPVTIDRMLVTSGGYIGLVPTEGLLEFRGLVLPLTLIDGEIRRVLNQLGYTELVSEFGLSWTWDEATETLLIDELRFAVADAGSIAVRVELGGITRAMMENSDAISEVALLGLTLNWAEIVVTDEAVADRLFQWTAEGTDTPPEQYRDEFIRGLPFLLAITMDRTIAAAISPALQEFLRAPSTLTISARPDEPVPLILLAASADESPFSLLEILQVDLAVGPVD